MLSYSSFMIDDWWVYCLIYRTVPVSRFSSDCFDTMEARSHARALCPRDIIRDSRSNIRFKGKCIRLLKNVDQRWNKPSAGQPHLSVMRVYQEQTKGGRKPSGTVLSSGGLFFPCPTCDVYGGLSLSKIAVYSWYAAFPPLVRKADKYAIMQNYCFVANSLQMIHFQDRVLSYLVWKQKQNRKEIP